MIDPPGAFAYEESDPPTIPPGMTIVEWRRSTRHTRAHRVSVSKYVAARRRALLASILAGRRPEP